MKINQVEELVGVTKRNIRYYEKEGLLTPGRNSENGYRDYSEREVAQLKRIKLLRKLDVPLEEIRRMQGGGLTLDDGLRRHLITLERRRSNLDTMASLCGKLLEAREGLESLDADKYLLNMEQMEREGTRFVNIRKKDTVTRYVGPVAAAGIFILAMAACIALMVWAWVSFPEESPPLPVVAAICAVPGAFILGALAALVQRIREIQGGEEDAAADY